MLTEVMQFYGLKRGFHGAGYFETDHHRQLAKDIRSAIYMGRLIAVTGIVATMPYIALQLVGIQVVVGALGISGTGIAADRQNVTTEGGEVERQRAVEIDLNAMSGIEMALVSKVVGKIERSGHRPHGV